MSYEWDLDGDGNVDSVSKNPTFTYRNPGIYTVTITAKNGFGTRSTSNSVHVSSNASVPVIDVSKSPNESSFLGVSGPKIAYNAFIDWKGTPGTVSFSVSGGSPVTKNATGNSVNHTFTIGQDIPLGNARSAINIVARNREGLSSLTHTDYICVTNVPSVLQNVGLQTDALGDRVKFTFETPRIPPSRIAFRLPGYGDFSLGIGETFAKGEAEINFGGSKTARLSLASEFEAMNNTVALEGGGSADFDLRCPEGIKLLGGAARVGGDVTITRDVGILEVVPGLSAAFDLPIVGSLIKTVSDKARLGYRVNPGIEFAVGLKQGAAGNLDFREITGKAEVKIDGFTKIPATDNLSVEAFVGGGGSGEVGYPGPLLRQVQVNVTAGVKYELDALFRSSGEYRYSYACGGTGGGISCSGGSSLAPGDQNLANRDGQESSIAPISHHYERFGEYEAFQANTKAMDSVLEGNAEGADISSPTQDAVLVSNVFPGASPTLLEVGNRRLALWERQDTSLAVHQSTNIAWSFFDGTPWSSPSQIAADTKAEFAPVAGVDRLGKVVACWLRIKDQSYSAPVASLDDIARFYTRLEVVSATFDPATRTWGTPTELTNDTAFDTSLRLVPNGSGQLMLIWISNPRGEFVSTSANPSAIRYSVWDGQSWSAPANVSIGQVGISTLSAAYKNSQAVITLARDPNPNITNDTVIDLYRWTGSWQFPVTFAVGGGDNIRPSAVFDTQGEVHIAWLRGGNLVHATLSNPFPNIVRPGSSTLSFLSAQLLINSQGNLTMLWQQIGTNTPPNLFARIYDFAAKGWSSDLLLNSSTAMARDVIAYYGDDGAIHLVYLSTEVTSLTQTITIDGKPQTINNIPQLGRTDLRILDHSLVVDLSISDKDLLVMPTRAKRGDAVRAELAIHNNGDFTISNGFRVDLYIGSPENNGVLLGSATVNDPLLAGEQRILSIPFVFPAKEDAIIAVVDSANSIRESSENNNRAKSNVVTNVAPQARIIADKTQGVSPLVVTFDASASYDGDKDAMSYNWIFGDGTAGINGANVTHTFDKPGCYAITLVAADTHGASSAAFATITVIDKAVNVSAASYSRGALAGNMIVAMFGNKLATEVKIANQLPLPNSLAGTTVKVKDSAEEERMASLFFVSPSQINYLLPRETAPGAATITVTAADGCVSIENIQIDPVSPGMFAANANGQGVAAAVVFRERSDGSQSFEPVTQFDAARQQFVAVPIDLGPVTDQVFLILYGTGWRGRGNLTGVTVKIGGINSEVIYAGQQGDFAGLDQINMRMPRSLAGRGEVDLGLTVDGRVANTVKVNVR